MKAICMFTFCCLMMVTAKGQEMNSNYDSILAKKFGADDYGMKKYVLVILKTGSNSIEDKAMRDSLFSGHLQNIRRLADMGKLVVAGPLGKNDNTYRGIFILNVPTMGEAKALLQTDMTIKAKLLEADLYEWYGAAALSEYLHTQEKITRIQIK